MSSPVWFVNLIIKTFSQIFTLAKLTHLPGLGRLIEYALFENDDIMYLPRDQVIPVNASLKSNDEFAVPSQIVEHFIEAASYHWVMDTCICRKASKCKDYSITLGCVFLGEAARDINPDLGRPVSSREALAHVRRCREAGLGLHGLPPRGAAHREGTRREAPASRDLAEPRLSGAHIVRLLALESTP